MSDQSSNISFRNSLKIIQIYYFGKVVKPLVKTSLQMRKQKHLIKQKEQNKTKFTESFRKARLHDQRIT